MRKVKIEFRMKFFLVALLLAVGLGSLLLLSIDRVSANITGYAVQGETTTPNGLYCLTDSTCFGDTKEHCGSIRNRLLGAGINPDMVFEVKLILVKCYAVSGGGDRIVACPSDYPDYDTCVVTDNDGAGLQVELAVYKKKVKLKTFTAVPNVASPTNSIDLAWTAECYTNDIIVPCTSSHIGSFSIIRSVNGTQIGSPISLGFDKRAYTDTGLTSCTNYSYLISANRPINGLSESRLEANAITQASEDYSNVAMEVYMSVPEDYKKEYSLPSDYEKAGLKELINMPNCQGLFSACKTYNSESSCNADLYCAWREKCADCGDSTEKSKIKGIITEYDPLNLRVAVQNLPICSSNLVLDVILRTGSEIINEKKVSLKKCDYINGIFLCDIPYPKGTLLNKRGNKVYATVFLMKDQGTFSEGIKAADSNIFIVAQYNIFSIGLDTKTPNHYYKKGDINRFYDDYSYYISISDTNKKIKYSAKPILFLNSLLEDDYPIKKFQADLNKKYPNPNYQDILVFYNLYGLEDSGKGSCSFHQTTGYNYETISLNAVSSHRTSLSHELGHAYSKLTDEYSSNQWYNTAKFLWAIENFKNPEDWRYVRFRFFDFKANNPLSADNIIRFPKCCLFYKCILLTYSQSEPAIKKSVYLWYEWIDQYGLNAASYIPECKSPLPFGTTCDTQDADDNACLLQGSFNCAKGSTEGSCKKPGISDISPETSCLSDSTISSSSQIKHEYYCLGMPYEDLEGNIPNDISISRENAKAYSIMGNRQHNALNVYPLNSKCPLRNCPD